MKTLQVSGMEIQIKILRERNVGRTQAFWKELAGLLSIQGAAD